MKLFLMVMLVALGFGGAAVAHDAKPAHYHAGQTQMAAGLLCDNYDQAAHILKVWTRDGFPAARQVYLQYFNDKSVSREGACVWMPPTAVMIRALAGRVPVVMKNGEDSIGMVATILTPDGRTYHLVLWQRVPGDPV